MSGEQVDMELFNLKQPEDVEIEEYSVEIWNRFVALDNLGDNASFSRVW